MLPVYNSCWKKKKRSPNISWNEKEELKYKGETVPGSNVVDLVNDVLSKRKYFNPQGWKHSEKPYEKQMFHKPDPLNPPATGGQFHRLQRVSWEIVV
jgi:hypothetical protein